MVESRSSPALRSDRARPPRVGAELHLPGGKARDRHQAGHRLAAQLLQVLRRLPGHLHNQRLAVVLQQVQGQQLAVPLDAQHPAGAGELQPVLFGQLLLGLLRHGDVLALPHPQLHRPVEPGDVQPPHRVLLRVPGGGVGLGPVLRLGIGQFRQAEALGGKAHRRRGAQEQASQSPGHRRKDLSPLHGSPPFPGSVAACAASL